MSRNIGAFSFVDRPGTGGGTFFSNFGQPEAAYSLRNLNGNLQTNVVRLRRSGDNEEQDFTAEEVQNETILNFVGSDDAFVVTWYDQSGNNFHASNPTASEQPILVNSGVVNKEGLKPSIKFDSSRLTNLFSTHKLSTPRSVFIVIKENEVKQNPYFYGNSEGQLVNMLALGFTSSSKVRSFINTINSYNDPNRGSFSIYTSILDSEEGKIRRNGVTGSLGNSTGTSVITTLKIGVSLLMSSSTAADGNISEIIDFGSNKNSEVTEIEQNINNFYNIY